MVHAATASRGAQHTSSPSQSPSYLESPAPFLTNYPVTSNEVGVLTIEPYKSILLPYWRFKDPEIAKKSSQDLLAKFEEYGKQGDFVGMDMARKFIQMGMTRAKRYANHRGGRKYTRDKHGDRIELPKSGDHVGKDEKEEASLIFRQRWQQAKEDLRYQALKQQFLNDRREFNKHNEHHS